MNISPQKILRLLVCCTTLAGWGCFGQGFGLGNYLVVSNTPLGGSNYEFLLRVSVTNQTADAQGVTAQVFSTATNTIIMSGLVGFGDLVFGQSQISTNTFRLQQSGSGLFDSSPLQWFVSVQSMPLAARISTPTNNLLINGTNVFVSGSVGPGVQGVIVGRSNATLLGTNYSMVVPLEEGRNIISVVATNNYGGAGSVNVTVNRDTTAPFVSIETPTNGATFSTRQITVTGQINDAVPGTVNPEQATVFVNGVAALLQNRSYSVADVLLAPGTNKIVVLGRDRAGNETEKEIEVVLREAVSQKRLVALGGDAQTGMVGTNLPAPLLVELVDGDGVIQTNQPVTFTVVRNDGTLFASPDFGRTLTLQTDDKGRASVLFQLGTRSGAGNNQVAVSSPGVQSPLLFNAHAAGSPPARVSALIPETQVGEVGKPLAQPWTALVTDAGGNPVAGTAISFLLMQGSGSFGGVTMLNTNTDSDGRASVILTLGPEAGVNNHVAYAMVPGLTNSMATFLASAQMPRAVQNTRVVGVVLDNANQPMSNVLCIIYRTFLAAVTDAQGRFVISNAPVGAIRLFVDARERGYPGEWHALEFDLVTVAGRDNSVDRPIYMLPLDSTNAVLAGGPQDVQLRLKGLPGATMTVRANSLRNNSGAPITNLVSWTQVNQERVPMAPPKGSQFSLAWAVQPPGLRFDPPARICIPNAGFNPGQMLEMFGFDHDLSAFVSLGTGTVTPDGAQVCSDPGFGVTKSGWGGFIPPWMPDLPPCAGVCSPPAASPCFNYRTIPPSGPCDCARYEELPKVLIQNVVAQVDTKKEASGGTNTIFNFTVTSTHPQCATVDYRWDFDDGENSTLQNPTHKFASYRTYHPKVTLTCQSCPKSKVTEQVTVAVAGVNLIVHKPKRIDLSEPSIPHDLKLTMGAQTFVNLDNDDGGTAFDLDKEIVVGGDDELMKVIIQLPGDVDPAGEVVFEVQNGPENVKFWKQDTKAIGLEGFEILPLTEFTEVNARKEYKFYLEGIKAHAVQRGTVLKATFYDAQNQVIGEDRAAVTVLGLAGLAWESKKNSAAHLTWVDDGFDHPLDLDPNWPLGLLGMPPAVRVFPDARIASVFGNVGPARDLVTVRATLSVAPVEPVQFHFRSFDVDDPTTNSAPVDDDLNNADDNRGTTPAQAGKIVGSDANGVGAVTFNAGEREKTFEFQTTMQPGDNFRVAGSDDPTFLLALTNDDRTAGHVGDDANRQRIIDPRLAGGVTSLMEVSQSTNCVTPTLTVWRFLHVETDSMRVPTEEEVTVSTSFTNLVVAGATSFLDGVSLPPDRSTNSDAAVPDFGRFENGTARIGTGASTVTIPIAGNGSNYISFDTTNAILPLEFVATEDGAFFPAIIAGVVTNIAPSGNTFVYQVHVTSQSSFLSDWSDFVGGELIIGGGMPVSITAANYAASSLASPAMNIPVRLWDDDRPSLLPAPPDLGHLSIVMGEVYVQVVQDGGGDIGYNDPGVPFLLNVPPTLAEGEAPFRRESVGTDAFWVGYVLQSFQYEDLKDNDPDSETAVLGVAFAATSNSSVTKGGNGTHVFTETSQDPGISIFPGMTARVTAHEIGHQMGLAHWDTGETGVPAGAVPANLMLRTVGNSPLGDTKLIPMHKNLIRSRVKSPGQ